MSDIKQITKNSKEEIQDHLDRLEQIGLVENTAKNIVVSGIPLEPGVGYNNSQKEILVPVEMIEEAQRAMNETTNKRDIDMHPIPLLYTSLIFERHPSLNNLIEDTEKWMDKAIIEHGEYGLELYLDLSREDETKEHIYKITVDN